MSYNCYLLWLKSCYWGTEEIAEQENSLTEKGIQKEQGQLGLIRSYQINRQHSFLGSF